MASLNTMLLDLSKRMEKGKSWIRYFIQKGLICLFVCLFVVCRLRIFHPFEDVTITGEGLQILTNARHSWPISCEGSLACDTNCDTGNPFIMVISESPVEP